MPGINKETWIALIKEGMTPATSFLSRSVDMSENVDYNTINLAEAGVDPKVIIDNTIFPVPSAQRQDTPLQLPLHTFDTENTIVRNIEEKESAYNKMESVVRSHRNALLRKTSTFAAHSWAPAAAGQLSLVVASAGAVNKSGLKAASFEDFLNMEARFMEMELDPASLVLVLNPIHRADLQAEDMKLYKEVMSSGKLFSFALFVSTVLPYYDTTTGGKKAYGAATTANDTQCSLIYSDAEVMRANGDIEVFVKYKDPAERGDIIGFQQRFTALQIRGKYTGAIYSGK